MLQETVDRVRKNGLSRTEPERTIENGLCMRPALETTAEFSLNLYGQWPEPILLLDEERFIDVNPAAIGLLGYPDTAALLGLAPVEISPVLQPNGERSASKMQRLLERVRGGETLRSEWVLLSFSGNEIYVDLTLSPIQQDARQLVLCTWHETGRLKQSEIAARQAHEALLKSNLELKHFAQVAAHELQAPLRTISVFIQLLHQEALSQFSEQARQWSALVVDGSTRMQALVEDLLSLSLLDSSYRSLQPVDSRQIFEQAKLNLLPRIQESGAIVLCGELPTVLGERGQLLQALQNLIENGIKYNASIPPKVAISAKREGPTWVFSVSDNGIGIDPTWHEQIFEMFRRLHSQGEYPGTGIGLAICRRAIERHGGRIWVESSENQGTTFCFTLPAADPIDDEVS